MIAVTICMLNRTVAFMYNSCIYGFLMRKRSSTRVRMVLFPWDVLLEISYIVLLICLLIQQYMMEILYYVFKFKFRFMVIPMLWKVFNILILFHRFPFPKPFHFFCFGHCFLSKTFERNTLDLSVFHISRLGARSWPVCALWLFWVFLESRDAQRLECWANPLWKSSPHMQSFHLHFEVKPPGQSLNPTYFPTVALSVFIHRIFQWSQIDIKEVLSVVGQTLSYGSCSSFIPQHQKCFVYSKVENSSICKHKFWPVLQPTT